MEAEKGKIIPMLWLDTRQKQHERGKGFFFQFSFKEISTYLDRKTITVVVLSMAVKTHAMNQEIECSLETRAGKSFVVFPFMTYSL